jgi:acetate kinase
MTPIQPVKTVLALNFGSASLKAARYALVPDAGGHVAPKQTDRISIEAPHISTPEDDLRASLSEVAERMPSLQTTVPDVVIHRIVHGGDRTGPAELTQSTLMELEGLCAFAPLHQPPALALTWAAIERWPSARQMGVFDTSWHHSMPEKHRLLPIPYALRARGLKRYRFHGLAFQSAMRKLVQIAPERVQGRVVLAHLGGGSSLCAVHEARCVATTMGLTPLSGIPMATRSGSLDPGVILHLQRGLGMPPEDIDRLLWHESGLRGLSCESGDMRQLLASHSDGAHRAIDVYVTNVAQGIAGMATCIGGIDVLVFSGGIGMHAAPVRAKVIEALEWLGLKISPQRNLKGLLDISSTVATVATFVLPIDEEHEMVHAVAAPELGQ